MDIKVRAITLVCAIGLIFGSWTRTAESAPECLSPRLTLPEFALHNTFAGFSSARSRTSSLLGVVDKLFLPDIPAEKKLDCVLFLAGLEITDASILRKLRRVLELNRDNALGAAIGALLVRNNPSFWLDDEYVRMDKEKFLGLLDKRGISLNGSRDDFIRALEGLSRVKERYLAFNPESWSYPYSCMHLSGIALMEELKDYPFISMLVARAYPPESNFFGFHAYLRVLLEGKAFKVDLTATQFHKLDNGIFFETGIVVIPEQDIRQDPEKFRIYAKGESLRTMVVNPHLPAGTKNHQEMLAQILNGSAQNRFVASLSFPSEGNNGTSAAGRSVVNRQTPAPAYAWGRIDSAI
ncbi:MAG: hypothetical protein PHO30_02435 [Candidatus Omnitrophica bacterium]|nr:hypothetical protein [Candidatus Omnitrophota bacterium]